jgi:hypothetical protein
VESNEGDDALRGHRELNGSAFDAHLEPAEEDEAHARLDPRA